MEEQHHPSNETEAVEQMKDNIDRLMRIMGDDMDLPDNVFPFDGDKSKVH